jgi:endonuclease-3
MTKKELALRLIEVFENNQPAPETELTYKDPYQLVVAVILSAQCTDKRVNIITKKLFERFQSVEEMAVASVEEILKYIKSCSYPNNKAKHLLGMAKLVVEEFDGKIPSTLNDLQKLPGVGRKTANVVASVAFGEATMPVDTHVFRVAHRIGLVTKSKTPREVEDKLVKVIPKEKLHNFHHWLILHGRYICQARKPKCKECKIIELCKFKDKSMVT